MYRVIQEISAVYASPYFLAFVNIEPIKYIKNCLSALTAQCLII